MSRACPVRLVRSADSQNGASRDSETPTEDSVSGEPGRRGGKRPGAGAPRGNLNALKHGHRSPYARAIVRALLAAPQVRRLLLALLREQSKKRASTVSKSLTFFLNNQKHDTELAKRRGPENP